MAYDIIVVGSCNIDLTNYVERVPDPGETIKAKSFETSFGGKGANQAVMAKLIGGRTILVGKVGNDFFGTSYKKHLNEISLNSGKRQSAIQCTLNILAVLPRLSVYVERVLPPLLEEAKLLVVQMEIDPQATLTALKLAKNAGGILKLNIIVITLFNTAPATKGITNEFYRYTDILCCNEVEMQQLTSADCLTSNPQLISGSHIFMAAGCQHVIITLGEKGAFLVNKKFHDGSEVIVPFKIEKTVDTTGSGDAFLGALAYFIVDQINANKDSDYISPEIVSKSVRVASLTVSEKGAQSSYLKLIKKIKSQLQIPV
ncbi:hypothetical protein HZS_173 [Henneguya salminicola]|nr:hypothetical protein HZS_173 [Henneguya salminicola]